MPFAVPFSLGLGTQESTFFPITYCAQTSTSFLSPFSLQQPALVCSPFPAPHTHKAWLVLVTLCIGDMSTCSYGWLQWLKQNVISSVTSTKCFLSCDSLGIQSWTISASGGSSSWTDKFNDRHSSSALKQLQALSCIPVQSLTFQHGSNSC